MLAVSPFFNDMGNAILVPSSFASGTPSVNYKDWTTTLSLPNSMWGKRGGSLYPRPTFDTTGFTTITSVRLTGITPFQCTINGGQWHIGAANLDQIFTVYDGSNYAMGQDINFGYIPGDDGPGSQVFTFNVQSYTYSSSYRLKSTQISIRFDIQDDWDWFNATYVNISQYPMATLTIRFSK